MESFEVLVKYEQLHCCYLQTWRCKCTKL